MPTDKFSLIYEYNNDSPLFTKVAAQKLSSRNYEEAQNILKEGIQKHPDYPTAYLLYGLALAYSGKIEEAKNNINRGGHLLGSDKTIKFYLNTVLKIEANNLRLTESQRTSFVPDKIEEDDDKRDEKIDSELNHSMDKLTNEIRRVKEFLRSTTAEESSKPALKNKFNIHPNLVSETLADIFIQQMKYDEAIEVYQKIMEKNPHKKAYCKSKIDKLILKKSETRF